MFVLGCSNDSSTLKIMNALEMRTAGVKQRITPMSSKS
jgi:hypothetical protein